jgi:hypothetical protein
VLHLPACTLFFSAQPAAAGKRPAQPLTPQPAQAGKRQKADGGKAVPQSAPAKGPQAKTAAAAAGGGENAVSCAGAGTGTRLGLYMLG